MLAQQIKHYFDLAAVGFPEGDAYDALIELHSQNLPEYESSNKIEVFNAQGEIQRTSIV